VEVCPAGAIKVKGNKVWVNEDWCIGCGVCQEICPHHAIRLIQISTLRENLLDYFEGMNIDLS
jgi:Fe-S-cluster-containing hydrogenase component 2